MSEPSPKPHANGPLVPLPRMRRRFSVPVALTSFLGREREICDVAQILDHDETRLVTLTGPGGVGKTRLALEVARRIEADFADGASYVGLAPILGPELVPSVVGQAVGVQERGEGSIVDRLVAELRKWHLLLVLDSYEHLLSEPPLRLAELLGQCPRLKVLVTSRTHLNISGEHRYLVPPLPVPEPGEAATRTDAVALFTARASATRADFSLSDTNREAIADICRQVDGLPLAIELAAARVSSLSPAEISSRLTNRFRLLTGGQSDAPARLRSMRDAVSWSYDLLSPDEQRLFRQLSVFAGGFTLEAAERVVAESALDPLGGVSSLVDKSLLGMVEAPDGESRYVMLETIREFALELLGASGEEDTTRNRHADWCVVLARTASPVDPVSQLAWFDRLDAEHHNLAQAMARLHDTGSMGDLADLVAQTRWLWYQPGREAEGLTWFERVLTSDMDLPATTRCDALRWAGHLAQRIGRPYADAYLAEAQALARTAGDTYRDAEATEMLAVLAEDRGDYDDAEARFRSARALYQQLGNAWSQLTIDYHVGVVAYGKGDLERATTALEAAGSEAEAFGDHLIPARTRNFLALIACERGDPVKASSLLSHGRPEKVAMHRHDWPTFLSTAGVVASGRGAFAGAARLFGAAARGATTFMLPERTAFERAAAMARERLGDASYEREWSAGSRMRKEQLDAEIDRLLSGGEQRSAPDVTSAMLVDGLTPRERDVLRLMADGLSNQQIADASFTSRKTVENHVANILGKLGVTSRTAAVAYAFRNALV